MRKRKDKLDMLQTVKIECPQCKKEFGAISYMLHIGICGVI